MFDRTHFESLLPILIIVLAIVKSFLIAFSQLQNPSHYKSKSFSFGLSVNIVSAPNIEARCFPVPVTGPGRSGEGCRPALVRVLLLSPPAKRAPGSHHRCFFAGCGEDVARCDPSFQFRGAGALQWVGSAY